MESFWNCKNISAFVRMSFYTCNTVGNSFHVSDAVHNVPNAMIEKLQVHEK